MLLYYYVNYGFYEKCKNIRIEKFCTDIGLMFIRQYVEKLNWFMKKEVFD